MKLRSSSPHATVQLGKQLGSICGPGDVICLGGDLGAGKTTLVQGIASGAGVDEQEYVNSPTFAILHEYHGRLTIYHMDFYRLGSSEDVIALGLEEYFYGAGVTLIEWYERARELVPESALMVELIYRGENSREISLHSDTGSWQQRIGLLESPTSVS